LVVVEGSHADFYIIQPNNTLSAINGAKSIPVNPKLFEVDTEGNLSLKGFDSAAIGSVFQVAEDGTLRWVESYSKEEVDRHIAAAVAGSAYLKRKVVSSVEEIEKYIAENNDGEQYVFMVPTGL
jgi:hypothetical protein